MLRGIWARTPPPGFEHMVISPGVAATVVAALEQHQPEAGADPAASLSHVVAAAAHGSAAEPRESEELMLDCEESGMEVDGTR
mmetsp:Transcript_6507/g.16859  ORF Transcript_6507/g.16859 Transcript_6507/m.16859 type:complete len:83 (-) Transcript_6507:577-825(-)